jgi:hypothetical protein
MPHAFSRRGNRGITSGTIRANMSPSTAGTSLSILTRFGTNTPSNSLILSGGMFTNSGRIPLRTPTYGCTISTLLSLLTRATGHLKTSCLLTEFDIFIQILYDLLRANTV